MTPKRKHDNPFAALLRKLRDSADKSMGQVARAIGVTTVYYSDLENARKPPPPVDGKIDFSVLASFLGGSADQLIDAAAAGRQSFRIEIPYEAARSGTHEVLLGLARRAKEHQPLTPEQVAEIKKILGME